MKANFTFRVLTILFFLRIPPSQCTFDSPEVIGIIGGDSGSGGVSTSSTESSETSISPSAMTPTEETLEVPPSLADSKSEKLTMPNANAHLQSIVGSSEVLQKLLRTRGFLSAEASLADPAEVNKLLARFKPKQGRFDPAMLDMLSNFDNNYSGDAVPNIFGNRDSQEIQTTTIRRRVNPTSTEESGVVWSPTTQRPNRTKTSSRFSSKFRNNTNPKDKETLTTTPDPTLNSFNLNHITDPNIRNHRLYEWEFEDYKNFTHIDQAEDLMADESDPQGQIAPTSASGESHKYAQTIIPHKGWKPMKQGPPRRPVSMEGSRIDSSGVNDLIPTDTYLKLPSDSEEPSGGGNIKLTGQKRPREPLRESSTENLVFTHGSTEDRERRQRFNDRYNRERFRSEEAININDVVGIGGGGSERGKDGKFRPSPEVLSPPVFVDPDQDFFTSTIRHPLQQDEELSHSHLPNFRPPTRKLKKNRGEFLRDHFRNRNRDRFDPEDSTDRSKSGSSTTTDTRGSGGKKYFLTEDEYNRHRDEISTTPASFEDPIVDRDRDPRPYPPPDDFDGDRDRDRPLKKKFEGPSSQEMNPFRKSDRILNPGQYPSTSDSPSDQFIPMTQSSDAANSVPYYHPSMPFGPASNEIEFHRSDYQPENEQDDFRSNYEHSLGDYLGGGGGNDASSYYSQNSPHYATGVEVSGTAGGAEYAQQSPAKGDQIYAGSYGDQFHHPFGEEAHIENYGSDGGSYWSKTYFILGGLIALSALTAFVIPSLLGPGVKGKIRNDLLDEEYVDENTSTAATSQTSTFEASSTQDPTADSDLWSEIKGVYNDVVKIVKGDYGGIVDKLTGSNTSGDKNPTGPNIVYRDDLNDQEEEEDEVDDETEFPYDIKHRHKHKLTNNQNHQNNTFKNRKGNRVLQHVDSSSGTVEEEAYDDDLDDGGGGVTGTRSGRGEKKKQKKNKTISSSINYIVRNNGPPIEQSTSRGGGSIIKNDTMATFYLGNTYLSTSTNRSLPFTSTAGSGGNFPTSTEGFLGEWAKVQLIGN